MTQFRWMVSSVVTTTYTHVGMYTSTTVGTASTQSVPKSWGNTPVTALQTYPHSSRNCPANSALRIAGEGLTLTKNKNSKGNEYKLTYSDVRSLMNRRKVLEEEYKLGVCITLRLIPKSRRATPNVQAINDEPNYLKHREREVSESVFSVTANTFDNEKPDGAETVEEAEVGD